MKAKITGDEIDFVKLNVSGTLKMTAVVKKKNGTTYYIDMTKIRVEI